MTAPSKHWGKLFWLYAALPVDTLPRWLVNRILASRIRKPTDEEFERLRKRAVELGLS